MTYRPDPRFEPVDYAAYIVDQYRVHSAAYRAGGMSVHVYRASLYALGWRGQDIETEVNLNAPVSELVVQPKYTIIGGTVVQTGR